jgi:hypothetical protein
MEDEESAYREAHFQEELDSLKVSVAHLTSFLKQALRNTSGEGPSIRPATFSANQPEEIIGEQALKPRHNPAFVQSTTPAVADAFTNESHKTKPFHDIDQVKECV